MVKTINELYFVFASNDGIKLTSEHFGDSEKFYFYKIFQNGLVKFDCFVENEFINTDESTVHGSKKKRQSIISSFNDNIDFIVASRMSPNFKKINIKTKICPIVSDIINIDECLDYLKVNIKDMIETKMKKMKNEEVEIIKI